MDALECIKTRRSIRVFQSKAVARDVIEDIVDCGRLAASANNMQPWEFVVVQNVEKRREISGITTHGNFIADSPVCIVVFCKNCTYYLEDGSAATQNILNAAHAHGLGSCWVAGDKKPYALEINRILEVPEEFKLISMIALGYSDQHPTPEKRNLQQMIHWETYRKE